MIKPTFCFFAALFGRFAFLLSLVGSSLSQDLPSFGAAPIPERTITPPPSPVFDVRTYGAVGDGSTYDTAAIQQAIDACSGTGGSVLLSGGSFVSAALELKADMTFHIAEDAVLLGGLEPEDYPEILPYTTSESLGVIWNKRSLLYANQANNLRLDGGGTIDGRGAQVKLFGIGGVMASNAGNRPSILRVFQSEDVVVRNLDVRNPRMWTMVYERCERLLIEHLDINAPAYYANLDGMDICDCREVIIRNCVVESEDDSICLKSHSLTGMDDILISNNIIICHNANAIKIGTATLGPIENIRIENNTILGAELGGLCIESVDGSIMRNVRVRGLDMREVGQPIFIRLGNRPDWRTATPNHRAGPGAISDVVIEDVVITNTHNRTKASNTITGISTASLNDITLSNISVAMPGGLASIPGTPNVPDGIYPQSNIFGDPPAYGFYVRYADGVTFEDITVGFFNQDARPWLASQNATVETGNFLDRGLIPRPTPPPSNTVLDSHATLDGLPEVFGLRSGSTHGQTFTLGGLGIKLEKVIIGYGAITGAATATTVALTIDRGNDGSNEISKQFMLTSADIAQIGAPPYDGIKWLELDVSSFELELPPGLHSFQLNAESVTGPTNSWLLAPAYTAGDSYSGGTVMGSILSSPSDANFIIEGPSADFDNLPDFWELSFPVITDLGDLNGTLLAGSGPGSGTGDFDGDGISDFDEYTNGTNPTLSDTLKPLITAIKFNDLGELVIDFTGANLAEYEVTKSPTLQASSFAPLDTPQIVTTAANGRGRATVSSDELADPAVFFRLELR